MNKTNDMKPITLPDRTRVTTQGRSLRIIAGQKLQKP